MEVNFGSSISSVPHISRGGCRLSGVLMVRAARGGTRIFLMVPPPIRPPIGSFLLSQEARSLREYKASDETVEESKDQCCLLFNYHNEAIRIL